jgi:hypothetical protein
MLRFNPVITEQKSNDYSLNKGKGTWNVLFAQEKISKSGNEMIELTLELKDCKGKTGKIFEYLLVSNDKSLWKTENFFKSAGKPEIYSSGAFGAGECMQLSGQCEIDNEENSFNGNVTVRPKIKAFVPMSAEYQAISSGVAPNPVDDFFNDDIPF